MIRRKLLIATAIGASGVVCACSDMTAPKTLVSGSLPAVATLGPQRGESQSEKTFDFTTIDVPGALSTSAGGINARGEIVGSYVDANHHSHGYVLRDGQFTTIDFPGSAFTEAWGIGPEGEVVGDYRFAGEPTVNLHGYMRTKDGVYVPVNDPPHINTVAQRILPDGTIIGCRHDTDQMSTMRGIVIKQGVITELDKFGSMNTGGTPDGQRIVGFYTDMETNRVEGFLIDGGQFTSLFVPGSRITRAFDINPAGEIVGVYVNSAGIFHGFALMDGSYVSIEVPGATATRAWGINPRGDIVGVYAVSGGMTHGFLTRLTRHN
jgi:uncharacterized membrane protein